MEAPVPGQTSLDQALAEERNVLNWVSFESSLDTLTEELWSHKATIEELIRQHMNLGDHYQCVVLPRGDWLRGGFNVCIVAEVGCVAMGVAPKRVIFRCPLPHKLGEEYHAGNVDEKLRGEVGAYAWIEDKCPEIPTAHLYGFGTSDGQHFTHSKHMPMLPRLMRQCWRYVYSFLGFSLLSSYVRSYPGCIFTSAYMVLEYLGPETGNKLSETYFAQRDDDEKRHRLFRDMSRIMLSLASTLQSRIGSLCFNDSGTITLTNRPVSCSMMIVENETGAISVRRGQTYTSTDAYVSDMLDLHDQRFLGQANAVTNAQDCNYKMAVKTLLRSSAKTLFRRDLRHGPFLLQLTDFNTSNLIVDEHWNIKGLIDLEWICALPADMLRVPHWLTGQNHVDLSGRALEEYDEVRYEFLRIFDREERKLDYGHDIEIAKIMRDVWYGNAIWFWYCLDSVTAMYEHFKAHMMPEGPLSPVAARDIAKFWTLDSAGIVDRKIQQRAQYEIEVRALFQ